MLQEKFDSNKSRIISVKPKLNVGEGTAMTFDIFLREVHIFKQNPQ